MKFLYQAASGKKWELMSRQEWDYLSHVIKLHLAAAAWGWSLGYMPIFTSILAALSDHLADCFLIEQIMASGWM
jgi:hypothetical protein